MYSDTAKNIDPNLPDGLGAEARRYLQAIKHELHCPRARKALFLEQMQESVAQYFSENPAAIMSDLTAKFGTPDEIAKSFLEEADPVVLGKSLRYGRRIFGAVLAVIALLAVVFSIIFFVDYLENEGYRRGHYVETVGEIPATTLN